MCARDAKLAVSDFGIYDMVFHRPAASAMSLKESRMIDPRVKPA